MSKTIDERVVSMEFDNRQFETNVRTSLSTLDKLKQSLNLTGAAKGLDGISASARNCNLSPLGNAVESVKLKFSALEVMAVTALANITNSAVNAGKRVVSALTIDPVKTGFDEYETQIKSVQTILANTQSKGSTLEDVNSALDELNTYADKTIYNFTEMTRNIGTFTAAGVDLEKSVTSIKGIANLGAISGSTSQQVSTAMYQLSQALATGTVKLMDWNSVVNAGMGGEVFQTALKRTAKQMGTDVDALIKKYGSFRESLTQGNWLTAEVLTETLTQLSGAYTKADLIAKGYTESQAEEITKLAETAVSAATEVKTLTQLWDTLKEAAQSGWTQSWEIIIGDFEEAKELWSRVSDYFGKVIDKSADKRNAILEGAMTSNWDKMIKKINEAGIETSTFEDKLKETLKNNGRSVDAIIQRYGSLEEAFRSGAVPAKLLQEAVNGLNGSLLDLSGIEKNLKKGDRGEDVKKVQQALKDLNYDLGKYGVDGIIGGYTEAAIKAFQEAQGLKVTGIVDEETIKALEEATGKTEGLGESVKDLVDGITELGGRELLIESFKNAWEALTKPIRAVKKAWNETFSGMTSEKLYSIIEGFHSFTEKLIISDESAKKITRTFKGLFAVLDIVKTIAGGALSFGFKILSKVLENFDLNILDVAASAGDVLVKFRDWLFENNILAKSFDKVIKGAKKGYEAIQKWIKAFIELPIVQENIDKFKDGFSDTFDNLKTIFGGIIDKVKEFINKFKSMDSISLENIIGIFREFKDDIVEYFMNLDNPFSGIIEAIKKFKTDAKKYLEDAGIKFEDLGEAIVGFVNLVKDKLGKNMGTIIGLGALLTILFLVKKIKDLVMLIAKPFSMMDDFLDGVQKLMSSLGLYLKTAAVKNIAISIGILAGSLFLLAQLDYGKLWSAVGAIAVLSGALIGIVIVVSKLKTEEFVKVSGAIFALAGSLLILAIAAKKIGGMNGGELAKAGIVLAAFIGIIVLLTKLTNKIDFLGGVSSKSFGLAIIEFAAAILVMSAAIKRLGSLDNATLIKGGSTAAGFLILMSGLMYTTKLLKADVTSFGKYLLMLSASLLILSHAIKTLGEMDEATLIKGGAVVTGFLVLMSGLMLFTRLLGKQDVGSFGKTIFGMSAGLLMIAFTIKILAGMDPEDVAKGSVVIVGFLGIMTLMMLATKMLGDNAASISKFGLMMLAFSGAVLVLVGAIALLGLLDEKDIAKGLIAIGAITLMFSTLMLASRKATNFKGIITMSIAMGMLAVAIAALSFVDTKKLLTATAALSIVMGMFAIVLKASSLIKGGGSTLLALSGAILILGGILYLLASLEVGSLLPTAGALSILLLSLATAMSIASKAGSMAMKGVGAMALMGLVVAELALILGAMDHFNVKPAIETAGALSILLLSMSAALGILSLVGMAGPAALIGMAMLAIFIIGLGALMVGIGALVTYVPEVQQFLDKGIPVLEQIGYGLGSFFGNIVKGFATISSEALPAIATSLSDFMTNLQPFLDGAKNIDESTMAGVKNLAESLLYLTAAELLDGITSWITGGSSLDDFATELVSLGEALTSFYGSISELPADAPAKIESVSTVVKSLVEIANEVPATGGLLQAIMGVPDLCKFAEGLISLGGSIKLFAGYTAGISDGSINTMSSIGTAIDKFVEIADKVPASDGILQKLIGVKSLSPFAAGLITLGPAIVSLSTSVSGIGDETIAKISKIGDAIIVFADVADNVPATDGLMQKITGVHDLSSFAVGLVSLGMAITLFSISTAGINDDSIAKISKIGESITIFTEVANNVPETDGWKQKITGVKSIGTFATELATFGEKIKEFSGKVNDISEDDINKMTKIASAAKKLIKMASNLEEYNDSEWFNTNLTEFAGEMVNFGEKMSAYSGKIKDIDTSNFSKVEIAAKNLISMSSELGEFQEETALEFLNQVELFIGTLQQISDGTTLDLSTVTTATKTVSELSAAISKISTLNFSGVDSLSSALTKLGEISVDKFIGAFDKAIETARSAGGKMVASLINGILSKALGLKAAITAPITNAVSAIKSKYSSFQSAGAYLVQGFANGITANMFRAAAAATVMAKMALTAARNALKINSPSKETYALGSFFGKGFANAIIDYQSKSYDAAYSMADSARNGLSKAISKVGDLIQNGIDTQPTIRPVLDLTDVESGAGTINGMFGMRPSVGVLSNLGSINYMMNKNQNGANSDVISAIEGLGRKLGNNSGDTYNFNGITYDDGSNVADAVRTIVKAARIERRR